MKAKRSFGQHFLTNERIAERIVDSLQLAEACGKVLEVGPGKGMLTKYLLPKSYELTVVEADRDMVDYLKVHFRELNGQIISGDFLKMPLEEIMEGQSFALIGNFPYNISSQILFKMVENRRIIPEMVGMFQKEVAERVVAPPGSKTYGVISVLIQAYYEGSYLFTVKSGSFSPPPKVQSAVIRLERREQAELGCDEKLFRTVVKMAFGQRRKMLRNTLKALFQESDLLQDPFFQQRPEALSVADFIEITRQLEQHNKL